MSIILMGVVLVMADNRDALRACQLYGHISGIITAGSGMFCSGASFAGDREASAKMDQPEPETDQDVIALRGGGPHRRLPGGAPTPPLAHSGRLGRGVISAASRFPLAPLWKT